MFYSKYIKLNTCLCYLCFESNIFACKFNLIVKLVAAWSASSTIIIIIISKNMSAANICIYQEMQPPFTFHWKHSLSVFTSIQRSIELMWTLIIVIVIIIAQSVNEPLQSSYFTFLTEILTSVGSLQHTMFRWCLAKYIQSLTWKSLRSTYLFRINIFLESALDLNSSNKGSLLVSELLLL